MRAGIANCLADLVGGEDATLAIEQSNRDAGQRGRAAALRRVGVSVAVEDDLITGASVERDRDGIAHRAGGEEERLLLAQQLGDHIL